MNNQFIESYKRGLKGMWTHPDPVEVINSTDFATISQRIENYPHTIWQIARHMMEWGWQIVNKLKGIENNRNYTEENNFFPKENGPESDSIWFAHQKAFEKMIEEAELLLKDLDFEKKFPEWDNITAADVMMILISHNSWHVSQIVALRKMLGKWDV